MVISLASDTCNHYLQVSSLLCPIPAEKLRCQKIALFRQSLADRSAGTPLPEDLCDRLAKQIKPLQLRFDGFGQDLAKLAAVFEQQALLGG